MLYHYFANKAELLTSVLDRYAPFAQIPRLLDSAAETSVGEVLQQLGRDLLSLLHARRQLVLTVLSEAPADPDLAVILARFSLGVWRTSAGFSLSAKVSDRLPPTWMLSRSRKPFREGFSSTS